MTAQDVLTSLEAMQVRLSLTANGHLHCTAPRGVLTRVLQGAIKTCKPALTQLLTTGEDTELPTDVSLPAIDYSRFRTWRTGQVPASAQMMTEPLPEPRYHDVPGVPETVLGPPCWKQGCDPNAISTQGRPLSTYYRRTRLCVRCLNPMKNQVPGYHRTTKGEEHELRLL
jgi:hypothetical protein